MLNRRHFVWALGGGGLLASTRLRANSLWRKPSMPVLLDRNEAFVNTICQLCPSACGLRVRLANGSPVGVTGNPLHPVNRGGMCARGGATLQLYYDPDRFSGPLKRNPALLGGFERITWDEGLAAATQRLQLAATAGPDRIAVIHGGNHELGAQLLTRLVRAARSSWVVDADESGFGRMSEVTREMHGVGSRVVYDLAGADFLMSFDSGLLEASPHSMALHRGFAQMCEQGGRFVHAGPRLGVTGSKAQAWLPIRAGSAGILALGVAHVVIKEGLADTKFLAAHAAHYEDWSEPSGKANLGIHSWILREFSPQRVSELTGVGWDQIIQTARRFGSAKRPLAVGPVGGMSGHGLFDLMAVHTLNAILGAIDVEGGVLTGRSLPGDNLSEPSAADHGQPLRGVEELARWILTGREPTIDLVVIHNADPLTTSLHGGLLADALRKVPTVVSTSPVPTDSTALAHLVLPDALFLERPADATGVDGKAYPLMSTTDAAARPRAEGRATAEVTIRLAKGVGGPVAKAFPWASYADVLEQRIGELHNASIGSPYSDVHHSTWTQLLERRGWRLTAIATAAQLGAAMRQTGGWWDPVYHHGEWPRVLASPERRIDLLPLQMAAGMLSPQAPLQPAADELLLYVYPSLALATPLSGSLPFLQDLASPLDQTGWKTVVEINPTAARARGIKHGERVLLRSRTAHIEAIACFSEGVRPEVVAMSSGSGRTRGGRYAAGIGVNPFPFVAAAAGDRALPAVGSPAQTPLVAITVEKA